MNDVDIAGSGRCRGLRGDSCCVGHGGRGSDGGRGIDGSRGRDRGGNGLDGLVDTFRRHSCVVEHCAEATGCHLDSEHNRQSQSADRQKFYGSRTVDGPED